MLGKAWLRSSFLRTALSCMILGLKTILNTKSLSMLLNLTWKWLEVMEKVLKDLLKLPLTLVGSSSLHSYSIFIVIYN